MTPNLQSSQNARKAFLSKSQLKERFVHYGFIEIADVLRFIEFACSSPPERSDYMFIRDKIYLCLKYHDNGSNYFIELREFASMLDAMISI